MIYDYFPNEVEVDFYQLLYDRNIKKKGAKNLNCALLGESGSGKSYTATSLCIEYYKTKLGKKFPIENIVFDIEEFLERVNSWERKEKCNCLIFDDAGLKYSSSKWFEELNQILGYTLQSYRYRIINVFFTIPVLKWLDRIGRGMLHGRIELKGVSKNGAFGAYYKRTYNQQTDTYYDRRTCLLAVNPPEKSERSFFRAYENKKHNFLQKEYDNYLKAAKRRNKLDTTNKQDAYKIADKIEKTNWKKYLNTKGTFSQEIIAVEYDVNYRLARAIAHLLNNKLIKQ